MLRYPKTRRTFDANTKDVLWNHSKLHTGVL
jgi:hypothetical protein